MAIEVPTLGQMVEGAVAGVGGAMPEVNRLLVGGYPLRIGCTGGHWFKVMKASGFFTVGSGGNLAYDHCDFNWLAYGVVLSASWMSGSFTTLLNFS